MDPRREAALRALRALGAMSHRSADSLVEMPDDDPRVDYASDRGVEGFDPTGTAIATEAAYGRTPGADSGARDFIRRAYSMRPTQAPGYGIAKPGADPASVSGRGMSDRDLAALIRGRR